MSQGNREESMWAGRGAHSTHSDAQKRRLPRWLLICAGLIAMLIALALVAVLYLANNQSPIATMTSQLNASHDAAASTNSATGQADTTSATTLPRSALIEDVPFIDQFPELPTGCEITAATMALDYLGFTATNTELSALMPKSDYIYSYDDEGHLVGPDPDVTFIGDPETEEGSFCNPGPVVMALNAYLESKGATNRATDITGALPEDLYARVATGTPVVVWVTTYMQDYVIDSNVWYSEVDGNLVESSTTDHAMVLVGYDLDEGEVTFNDPIAGEYMTYDMNQFEAVFLSRGSHAVVIG